MAGYDKTFSVLIGYLKLLKLLLYVMFLSFAASVEGALSKGLEFSDFQEPVVKITKAPHPKLVSNQDREFRTRILEAVRQPVNFAGRYVFSSFGCGAGCSMSFALDKRSGKVTWLPFTVCCSADIDINAEPISFRKDSRLMIITGSRDEQGKGVYYYEFKNSKFVLIKAIEH